jgi:hypothetical protein
MKRITNPSFLKSSAGAFKFLDDELFIRENSLILGREHLVGRLSSA